jgi:dienelactone hydrolase
VARSDERGPDDGPAGEVLGELDGGPIEELGGRAGGGRDGDPAADGSGDAPARVAGEGAAEPNLSLHAPGKAKVTGVVLLLHGGAADSVEPVRPWNLALARMRMFIAPLQTRSEGKGVAVALLRDRIQGWNGAAEDARADAAWALDRIVERYGPVPVALIGHSMGGRAALRVGGHPSVTGVAALAPWTPEGEPVEHLLGRTVMIAHGDLDRSVDPAESLAFARRAAQAGVHVCRLRVEGGGHAMLGRLADWNILAADFALAMVGVKPLPAPVVAAFAEQAGPVGQARLAELAAQAEAEYAADAVNAEEPDDVGAAVQAEAAELAVGDEGAVAGVAGAADPAVAGSDQDQPSEADPSEAEPEPQPELEEAEPEPAAEPEPDAEQIERNASAGLDLPLPRGWRRRWH